MRILYIHCVADRSERELVHWCCQRSHHVSVISDPRETERDSFERSGAHVITLRIRHRLDLKAIRTIRRLCIQKPIDVIYASFNAGLSCALIATLGLPTRVVGYRGTLGNLSRLDPSSYLTHLSPRLNGIICNCEPVRTFLLSLGIPRRRTIVILKGHDASWYESAPKIERASLGIPSTHIIIGLVANMRPLKGVDYLLEACTSLVTEHPITLLLIGVDPKGAIQKKINSLGLQDSVRCLGFRTDAAQLAQLFDIACLPSTRREGVPRSIVEAMCHGIPSVVTNVGGLPEIIINERNGLVVPAMTVEPLRAALKRLIEDPSLRARLGSQARDDFKEKFNLVRYCSAMENYLTSV